MIRLRVGEDGPTHEPIEQLLALRAVPGLTDFRPADANETAAAWRLALERKGPSFFALSRQDLPVIDAAARDIYAGVSKGAYVLEDAAKPQVVLIGTGAEVWPCVEAAKLLAAEGIRRAGGELSQLEAFRGANGRVQGQRAAG